MSRQKIYFVVLYYRKKTSLSQGPLRREGVAAVSRRKNKTLDWPNHTIQIRLKPELLAQRSYTEGALSEHFNNQSRRLYEYPAKHLRHRQPSGKSREEYRHLA